MSKEGASVAIEKVFESVYENSMAKEEQLSMTILTKYEINGCKSTKWNGPYYMYEYEGCEDDIVCVVLHSETDERWEIEANHLMITLMHCTTEMIISK